MTEREAMKQALEALNEYVDVVVSVNDPNDWRTVADGGKPARDAITSLRQAIAELESQEPMAWIEKDIQCDNFDPDSVTCEKPTIAANGWEWVALYTHPPQRTWVGLTDEEKLVANQMWRVMDADGFIKAIEAKLKEKNT